MSALHEHTNGAATATAPVPAAQARVAEARARLRAENAKVAAIGDELSALQEPANRLGRLAGDADKAERRRVELQTKDLEILGAWLATGDGERPEPSPELIEVEQLLVQLRRDRSAAELVSPNAHEAYNRKAAEVVAAARIRDQALYALAGELAIVRLDELRQHIHAAVRVRQQLEGVCDALSAGPMQQNGGGAVADRIRSVLVPMLKIGLPRDTEAGARFLARLAADPDAVLG